MPFEFRTDKAIDHFVTSYSILTELANENENDLQVSVRMRQSGRNKTRGWRSNKQQYMGASFFAKPGRE